jgi:hypothetical protein
MIQEYEFPEMVSIRPYPWSETIISASLIVMISHPHHGQRILVQETLLVF